MVVGNGAAFKKQAATVASEGKSLHKAALEDYRERRISEGRFAEILGISRWEAQEILDQHHARHPYTLEMLEEDRRNLASIFGAQ